MVSIMFSHFPLQVFEKSNLEVMDFGVFSALAILEWYLTRHFKHFLYVRIFQGVGILVWLCYLIVYAEYIPAQMGYFILPPQICNVHHKIISKKLLVIVTNVQYKLREKVSCMFGFQTKMSPTISFSVMYWKSFIYRRNRTNSQ